MPYHQKFTIINTNISSPSRSIIAHANIICLNTTKSLFPLLEHLHRASTPFHHHPSIGCYWESREDREVIEERLDRFCASVEWSVLFPEVEVVHLDEQLSDYLPRLVKLQQGRVRKGRGRRHFQFKNMWLQEESCRQLIKEVWEATAWDDPWTNVTSKIDGCSRALARWNHEMFGEIQHRIRQLAEQLKGEKNIHRRRNLLNEISSLRRKEEVFWA
ncbi:hypothetical protein Cgig2_032971 [Carnegiea gigantea]|uniref:Uncharacterized protein n=1 Tax=Carnegiea gigantea TaxID=171969 RepID=A0A9Q1K1I9_9CARY|nr:hypothetical protein Cgig2_032971 [Carnegiea gigantea]